MVRMLLLLPMVLGREVVLRNEQALDDRFDEADEVVHLDYPACAVAVLEPAPEDLPLTVHTVQVFLGSSLGNQDRQITLLTMGMQVLQEGEPPRLPGYADWDWPEAAFYVTVSSEYLNGLSLDDPAAGLYPYTLHEGRLAVFVCTPDPSWEHGYDWPCEDAEDCSGLVVETGSPSDGSWIVPSGPDAEPITSLGIEGAWVIRAVGEAPGPDDTGEPTPALALDGVEPSWATLGDTVALALHGEGFDEGLEATIGGLPVGSLVVEDGGTATGRSPSGLPVGWHDVVLTSADGAQATLLEAFEVRALAEEEPVGCGCGVGSIPAGGWLALLAPLWLRRRRDQSRVAR